MLTILFFGGLLTVFFIVLKNPPKWIIKNNEIKKWKNFNIISFVISIVSFLPVFFLGLTNYNIFAFSGIGFLTYSLILSLYTDFKFRYVDRRVLNTFLITSLILSVFIVGSMDEASLVLYIILVLMTFSTIYIPIFGASDGRILTLGTILLYPIGELNYYIYSLILMIILVGIYAGYKKIKQYKTKDRKKKVSIPAVPFFAFSFLCSLVISFLQHT